MANYAEQDGTQGFAEVMRSDSRKKRAEVLELTGKLAPLNAGSRRDCREMPP
jgi:hypothetical protein